LAFGAGGLVASQSLAADNDGRASGYDVAPASDHPATIPRRTGDPVSFTASLDSAPIKATSGGWAREITMRSLPIATGMAVAHLFLNPGGSREMHWHNSAEWAYIADGHCQVTLVDAEGVAEIINLAAGNLWFFPKGHSHAIQTLGSTPCHAIPAFDDGLYSEHGTFGISDWMLAQAFGVAPRAFTEIPKAETYIMQGEVLALDGPQARAVDELDHARTHRHRLLAQKPRVSTSGGVMYLASAQEFPMSKTMTGWVIRLKPGAMHEPHWHPNANEWHYALKGQTRATLFASDKRMAVAELSSCDCAYVPRGSGHSVRNVGSTECEIIGVLDSGTYRESSLPDWVVAPRHLLADNFGVPEGALVTFRKQRLVIAAAA
jgi:oxalate decarboxylase